MFLYQNLMLLRFVLTVSSSTNNMEDSSRNISPVYITVPVNISRFETKWGLFIGPVLRVDTQYDIQDVANRRFPSSFVRQEIPAVRAGNKANIALWQADTPEERQNDCNYRFWLSLFLEIYMLSFIEIRKQASRFFSISIGPLSLKYLSQFVYIIILIL